MLKTLQIQNFKGWQDTNVINLAPLTLFFGVNSSGKSSIGQFLMMLKQTVELSDRKTVFYSGSKNSAVQLGSFQEMLFEHKPENRISFNYSWSLPEKLKFSDPITGKAFSGDSLFFKARVGLEEKTMQPPLLRTFAYELLSNGKRQLGISMQRSSGTKINYKVEASGYALKRKQGRVWLPGAPVRFYGFPDEVVAYYQNADFVQNLNLQQEKLFHSIWYLGPLRIKADRIYTWAGTQPESVGYAGENCIAAILAARKRVIGMGPRRPGKPFEVVIATHLKTMDLIDDFKVKPIADQRQDYEVKIRTKGSKEWVDLPDVGFGISQVLPVLVQCFYAPANSTIIMEQPELHLHPKAQSALADVVIDAINAREDGKDRNIQLIIETHSEHFLRRLQRRIAEGAIAPDRVSAWFANAAKHPAKLEHLKVDSFGNILNWPKDFFGDEMGDIFAQNKAALEKRLRQADKDKVAS